MAKLKLPAFGEQKYSDEKMREDSRVVILEDVEADQLAAYCGLLEAEGYVQREQQNFPHRAFRAYEKKKEGVFLNWFAGTQQLQIVTESNCAYFDYRDTGRDVCTTARLTQVYLSDYGLSDVIRLPDGRLIIIDGANVYEKDIENLYARLKKDAPFETPVIAAWIMTHPHSDHYNCFIPFMEKYGQTVVVEKLLYNFPQHNDYVHYPKLEKDGKAFSEWYGQALTGAQVLQLFCQKVKELGIPVYTPHTGQRYRVGDALLQFYGTMDDTIHRSTNINATSLMFTMDLAGQRIFFGGDGSFSDARLAERYGAELKCDILQVPHHGFGCGTEEGQIRGYRMMQPKVCLLPVEKHLAYTSFTTYREGTRYLMTELGVQEMITGEKEHTLELPYEADPAGAYELEHNYLAGRDATGAKTWVFTDLNTGKEEDFWFNILNSTYLVADLQVEIFPENMQKKTVKRMIKGPRLGIFRVNCLITPEDDPETFRLKELLETLDIPENTYFAVRFTSSIPVVISHREHQAAYHSTVV